MLEVFSSRLLRLLRAGLTILLFSCGQQEEGSTPLVEDCRLFCSATYECDGEGGEVSESQIEPCVRSCRHGYDVLAVEYGESCEVAYEDALRCVGALDCTEFRDFLDLGELAEPCSSVVSLYFANCPGVFIAPGSLPG